MPVLKIDIGAGSYKNIGEVSTKDGISPLLLNGYKNDADSDVKRPGMKLFCNLDSGSSQVDGLHWNSNQQRFYAISNGKIYTINSGGVVTQITLDEDGNTVPVMEIDKRASFVESNQRTFMANDSDIIYSDGNRATSMSDTDAPTGVTSLAELDTYILADGSGANVQFSDANNTQSWTATNVFAANSRYDNVIAIKVLWKEVYCFGRNSVDVFYNDGSTPFSKLDGAFVEEGCIAPDSIAEIGNTLCWLNEDKKVVMLSGRAPQMISIPYDKEIQSYNKVDDAYAIRIQIAGKDFYILSFPTQDVTLVYDVINKQWYQWSYWNVNTGQNERMKINCHAYVPEWNKHFVGDRITSQIFELSPDYFDDNGDKIRFVRRTGNIAHDTMQNKRSNELVFKIKRGEGGNMKIRWRNNNKSWGNEHLVSLGSAGDNENIAKLKRCGIYRNRQYEIIHTDATSFELTNPIYEDVELLR